MRTRIGMIALSGLLATWLLACSEDNTEAPGASETSGDEMQEAEEQGERTVEQIEEETQQTEEQLDEAADEVQDTAEDTQREIE